MIGDPKATTLFKVRLSHMKVVLTSSTHYLPTLSSLLLLTSPTSPSPRHPLHHSPPTKLLRRAGGRRATAAAAAAAAHTTATPSLPPSPSLPCLCVLAAGVEADLTLPMYRGNALPGLPQSLEGSVSARDVKAGLFSIVDLGECVEDMKKQRKGRGHDRVLSEFFAMPLASFAHHSDTYCSEEEEGGATPPDGNAESADTSRTKLEIATISVTLSSEHVSKCLFVFKSWVSTTFSSETATPPPSSQIQYRTPFLVEPSSRLHVILNGLGLGVSTSGRFVARSLELGGVRAAIRRRSSEGASGGSAATIAAATAATLSPFLYGPLDTAKWSHTAGLHSDLNSDPDSDLPAWLEDNSSLVGKLVEVLVTTPRDEVKGELYQGSKDYFILFFIL